jgi:hypothetical protein
MCGQPNFNASHIYYTQTETFNRHIHNHIYSMHKKLSEPKKSEKSS